MDIVAVLLPGWSMPDMVYHSLLARYSNIQIIPLPYCKNVCEGVDGLLQKVPKGVDVIGHSLGGNWAIELLKKQHVHRVFCVGTNPQFVADDASMGCLPAEFEKLQKGFEKNAETALRAFDRQNQLSINREVMCSNMAQQLGNGLSHLRALNSWDFLRSDAKNITLCFGRYDRLVPYSLAAYAAHFACDVSVVAGEYGHIPFGDCRFDQELDQWLSA